MDFFDIDNVDLTQRQSFDAYVSPEMAQKMLQRNIKNNRRINEARVAYWLRLMHAGRFEIAHPVYFSRTGFLVNGQHRLTALSKCGTPQKLTISLGHEESIIEILDEGMPRTTASIMAMRGLSNVQYFPAMLQVVIGLAEKKMVSQITFSKSEVADLAEIYADKFEIGVYGRSSTGNPIKTASVMGSAVAASFEEDNQRIKEFLRVWHTGLPINGTIDNAALSLRNSYLYDKGRGLTSSKEYKYKFSLKTQAALKFFLNGVSPTRIVTPFTPIWSPGEFTISNLKWILAKKKRGEF
jgi:hypothetical protein